MIVEFSVQNFRSIKEIQTLSFQATGLKSSEENSSVDENNIGDENGHKLLKTIGIYGANGSGKSNVTRAFEYFLRAINNEASSESNLSSLCEPFLYQDNSNETESFFQIVLILNNKKYRYGFTVKKNPETSDRSSREIITSEWLYGTKDKNMGEYFVRKDEIISKDKLENSEKIPELPYKHTLFITHAAAFDKEGVCSELRNFFRGRTISNVTAGMEMFRWNSLMTIEQEGKKDNFLSLLSTFNLKYDDITIEREKNDVEIVGHDKIFFTKRFKNSNNESVDIKLNLHHNESDGTRKLFDIAGLLLRAFATTRSALVILDEVDSNFHPSLLIKVIQLFNNPHYNKSNSQLLFTSHDTNLMSPSIMRRDQFYFTEKREDNSTRLYSLADLNGIRNDADFAKQYLVGYYGAIPILDNLTENFFENGTLES